GEVDGFGAWSDPAHLAREDIDDLRELVDAKLSQEDTNGCHSRILVFCVAMPVLLAHLHGAQLEDLENATAKAHALLHEEDRAPAGELDCQAGEQDDERKDWQHKHAQDQVDQTLRAG